jgi:hypothetical protein
LALELGEDGRFDGIWNTEKGEAGRLTLGIKPRPDKAR